MLIHRFVFAGLLLSFSVAGQGKKDLAVLTTAQWLEDLHFYKQQVEAKHLDAFHHQPKAVWDERFVLFEKQLPTLKTEEILTGLMALGASVGDGHSAVRPYDHFKRYPVHFMWFGEDLMITRIGKEYAQFAGAKVLKIGNHAVADVHQKLLPLIPAHESPTFLLSWSEALLRIETVLAGAGISAAGRPLELTVALNGRRTTVSLMVEEGVNAADKVWAFDPLPMHLMKPEQSPYYEFLPGADGVLYFNFENYPEWNQLRDFGMGLIKFIGEHRVEKLVVDLRENGGGDFKKGLRLIEEMQKTYLNAPGKVYVIIGRGTFSAGMSNAAHFKTMLGATLVGEVTGGRPVGYQENFSFTLPHSGIQASCSIKKYAFLPVDTDGIIPDKEILPDFSLSSEGRDAAVEWILKQR